MIKQKKRVAALGAAIVLIFMLALPVIAEEQEILPEETEVVSVAEDGGDPVSALSEEPEAEAPQKASNTPFYVGALISVAGLGGVVIFCRKKGR